MLKIFALCFLVIGFLSAAAQSDGYGRCDVSRREDVDQFERWLISKQVMAVTKLSTVYKIPIVVHVIHTDEQVGEGFNHSVESELSRRSER